jgi:hypothetical protein
MTPFYVVKMNLLLCSDAVRLAVTCIHRFFSCFRSTRARTREIVRSKVSRAVIISAVNGEKKPPTRAEQLHSQVKESVDFKRKHIDKKKRKEMLAQARKWLSAPLEDFLREMEISESDPEYAEFVAIWREFHP